MYLLYVYVWMEIYICIHIYLYMGFPSGSDGKEPARYVGNPGSVPELGRFPWRRKWQPTPVFLPGKLHGQRNLEGYSLWSSKESDKTEQLTLPYIYIHINTHIHTYVWKTIEKVEKKNQFLIKFFFAQSLSFKLGFYLFFSLSLSFSLPYLSNLNSILAPSSPCGEGNGTPLQYSCLENPRDGGAWWAAVYGVSQNRAELKWLSGSSSSPWTTHPSHSLKCLHEICCSHSLRARIWGSLWDP